MSVLRNQITLTNQIGALAARLRQQHNRNACYGLNRTEEFKKGQSLFIRMSRGVEMDE